ncbi:MAG: prepilin peptidase, partial [Ignavibacteriales bacterium]|nr:prepilin peptidase [Ignavibacteriales bacterium]
SGQYVYSTSFIVLMVLVAVIDWQYFIIPNTVVITGIILGLILHLVFQPDQFAQHLLSSLFAFCSTLIILLLGNWLFKKPSMGMGDVKLAGLIGFFLGIQDFLVAFWLAAILGALYGMFAFGFHGSSKGSNLPPQNPPVGKQGQGRFRPPLFEAVQKVIITVIASEAKQPQPLNFPRNVRLLRHFVTRNDAFGRFLDSHMSRLGTEGVMMSTEFNPRFATTFDEGVLSSTKLPFGSFLALSSSVVLLLSDMIDKWIQVWLISLQ